MLTGAHSAGLAGLMSNSPAAVVPPDWKPVRMRLCHCANAAAASDALNALLTVFNCVGKVVPLS